MFSPCLLVPIYNHGSLVEATLATLKPFGLPCLLVDDGSEPATARVLDAIAAREPWVSLLRLPQNAGKGAAVIRGLEEAQRRGYSHALQVDADGQHNAADIPALLQLARSDPSALVSGIPQYGDDIPKSRLYGRYITHAWVWIETLSFAIRDSMCGFRVYPVAATLAAARHVLGRRMDFDTEIMVRLSWAGTPMLFLPTAVHYPPDGISHFQVLRDNVLISLMHTRLACGMLLRLPWLLWRKCRPRAQHPQHWSEQGERGSIWGMQASLWCYRVFGRGALYALLYPIIGWFFLFAGAARAQSRRYLERATGRPVHARDVFRHFMAFGRSVVDRLAAWSGEIHRDDVVFRQRELLVQQAASGQGAVILTSHLGNVDMCRALVSHVPGIRMNVLVFTGHARAINRVLRQTNPGIEMELIQVSSVGPDTAILLQEKISRGEFVVIAADRTSPTSAHRVSRAPFLGAPAPFPQGPFILAALMECPVYLLFALKTGPRYEIFLESFAERLALPRRQREALLREAVSRYAQRLEYYCRLTPFQWFNFFNFWQDTPTAETLPSSEYRES